MKLLIISTGAGTGHVQAAAALEEAARRSRPDVEVLNVDALDYGTPFLRDLYAASYVLMANRFPSLWGFLYEKCESERPRPASARILGLLDRHNARGLIGLVRRWKPDRIVCTHFLPPSALRRETRVPMDVVVTDFDVHSFWIQPEVRRFFVATEAVGDILRRKGIDGSRISAHGIPVSDRFRSVPSRAAARATLGLDPGDFVLLTMGGGFGRRGLLEIVAAAVDCPERPTVLAVAGRNESMRTALEKLYGDDPRVRVYRFVRAIESLMAAADLIVTKPGGLTTAESLAVGRPLLLTTPVPGQEERNASYLVGAGAARTAVTPRELRENLASLLANPTALDAMARAALEAGRPAAAGRIIAEVLGPADPAAPSDREFMARPGADC